MIDQRIEDKLEQLIRDTDFLRIERISNKFNIFRALRLTKTELKHSNFITYLLDPARPHGLSDEFVKQLLCEICRDSDQELISPLKLQLMDMSDCEIRREWNNLDILIISRKNRLVCAIENKIDARESRHQLAKYRNIVEADFGEYEHKFFAFLTPDGRDAQNDEGWVSLSYAVVERLLSEILNDAGISVDVRSAITDYLDILRNEVMDSNEELRQLCMQIYAKHKDAINQINRYAGDVRTEIFRYLINEIETGLGKKYQAVLDGEDLRHIRFADVSLDQYLEPYKTNDGKWTSSNRIALYEVENKPDKPLTANLVIRTNNEDKLLNLAQFLAGDLSKVKGRKWIKIAIKPLTQSKENVGDLENFPKEEIENYLHKYFMNDYQQIREKVKQWALVSENQNNAMITTNLG